MSYPPYPPDPNRPHDPNRPQDTPREQPGQQPGNFPTYGRPQQPAPQQNPYERPQDPAAPFVPPSSPVQGSPYEPPQQGPPNQGPPQGPQYPGLPYPQQGYGYGYQAVQQVRTNSLATAALVCGLVAIFLWILAPIAVGLGIAALVQIKRRQESGTAQAVVGLSLGSLISLVGVVVLLFMFAIDWTGSEQDYGSDQPVSSYSATPDEVNVDELAVGECFDDGYDEGEVVRTPCLESHDGEMVATVTLPAGTYPGDEKVQDSAQTACRQEFTKYVGIAPDKSVRTSTYWTPDENLWDDGDRLVVCAAHGAAGGTIDGSVKGTKR